MSIQGSESLNEQESSDCSFFEKYNKKIDDLYLFRDKYYLINDSDQKTGEDRNNDLQKKLTELVNELEVDRNNLDSEKRASFLILMGKAYNVMPEFNQTACDSLKKATKLDPKSVEAWNYLGECYWKKRDFKMCRICFEQSLSICRNIKNLRGMSMVIRQLITDVPKNDSNNNIQGAQTTSRYEHIKNSLEESIKYAKESLQLDVKDGMSWYILANCYVSKFFSPFGQETPVLLKMAVSAYNLALKDKLVMQSDLYFNKSMISMYEENWSDALYCLSEALKLDPHWVEANENLNGTLEYLTQLHEMIAHKGKLKERKFQSLIESIRRTDLGPYLEHTKDSNDKSEIVKKNQLVETTLSELQYGLNKNKVLIGKIVCGLPTKNADNIICFTVILADSNGDCAALTIYNLAKGQGVIIGNSVCIPEPWLECQNFKFSKKTSSKNENACEYNFEFKSIRVENPTVLVVNGKKWTKEKLSSAFFVPKVMSD